MVLMNREILFKAKAINRDNDYFRSKYKNGDWVYGLVTKLYDERFETLPAEMTDENGISRIEVDHNTICQYTGILDKNKNKIWENDVVMELLYGKHKLYYKVTYNEEEGSYMLATKDGPLYGIGTINSHKFEVVGNIFDNPEFGFSLKDSDNLECSKEVNDVER